MSIPLNPSTTVNARQALAVDGRSLNALKFQSTQGDAQATAGQHHHHPTRARPLGQVFGMAGEGNTGIVDHPLVHRRRDHRGKFSTPATGQSPVEQGQHIRRIGGVKAAWPGYGRQGQVQHVESAWLRRQRRIPVAQTAGQVQRRGPFRKQLTVRQYHDACAKARRARVIEETQADIGADTRRIPGRDGNRRQQAAQRSSSRSST